MNTQHHHKEVYPNSRTIQQPRWHGWELSWFTDKMQWQYKEAGIKFYPIPWSIRKI